MRAFTCPHCSALVFFENSVCLTCSTEIAFSRAERGFVERAGRRACANLVLASCNWLAEDPTPDDTAPLCGCCALTRTRPSDDDAEGLAAFALTEAAKRRLIYQLDDLRLPVVGRGPGVGGDEHGGLAFDLLSSENSDVITGHANGVVTLDLAEGDAGHRERLRIQLDEPYRTLLGHLRHETGHWYWEVLVERTGRSEDFRRVFGDERADYGQALQRHYDSDPPANWDRTFVSTYATAHPWEDWAETFAHYLHIRDTSQTAAAFGVVVNGPQNVQVRRDEELVSEPRETPSDFAEIVDTWLPLTYALNAVNRSMGNADLYPFVLTPAVLDKLRSVHELVTARSPYTPAAPVPVA
ncbi:MAG: putative zinc-binding peptidase [Pseudonocardia sp.]|nr:putative zinc-binding peptidase [Pseudonocardia sp.]